MVFSSSLANTFPLASLAMQVGFSEGRTRTTGPARSVGVSAETQLWSSWSASSGALLSLSWRVGLGALEVEGVSWSVRILRFLGLSPLKVKGLTILVVFWCWGWVEVREGGREVSLSEMVDMTSGGLCYSSMYSTLIQ